ncbi:MAG: site-2 protease family protein [Bacillota bacterium]|nr:site-2 protease family protein [Bacillota bacterium]
MTSNNILNTILLIPGILLAFTFHEYAHAFTADRLGDKTPRFQGRLSFNPLVHIDPIGFIAILIFKFGWAKPVQVNPRAFKNYYKDDLKVSIAGVIGNLILAFLASVTLGILFLAEGKFANINAQALSIIIQIVYLTLYINCVLAVFNLLPIPGFDGFNILKDLFPKVMEPIYYKTYRYQIFIFLIIIYIAPYIINTPINILINLFMNITNLI